MDEIPSVHRRRRSESQRWGALSHLRIMRAMRRCYYLPAWILLIMAKILGGEHSHEAAWTWTSLVPQSTRTQVNPTESRELCAPCASLCLLAVCSRLSQISCSSPLSCCATTSARLVVG